METKKNYIRVCMKCNKALDINSKFLKILNILGLESSNYTHGICKSCAKKMRRQIEKYKQP
jgi:hypothetical protein